VAERSRYLVTYDIRDARRLRRVHGVARDYGYPLQYSVFVCDLTKVELLSMKGDLLDEVRLTEDSIGIFDPGKPDGRGIECVEYLGTRRTIPDSGQPTVW
jgi:CRISPR-associated protein Cas2